MLLAGCANPGQPRPPSLRLPEKAEKVTAERVGGSVIVSWTTPAKTTDKAPIRGPVNAVICREATASRAASSAACVPQRTVSVAPGTTHAETLPAVPATGALTLLTYRVELLSPHGRSAGLSQPAFAAGGAAPPPTGPLTVSGRREGALIAWAKSSSPAQVRVVRTQLAPAPQPRQPNQPARPLSFTNSAEEAAIVNLKTPDQLNADPGGVIDHGAQNQYTYSYTAERVATVELSGHRLELHSAISPPATFTYRDIFPPQAPTGLVSVAGGGFGQAQTIDLSWEANLETDLLGYNVYRKDAGGGDFVRLTAEPVPAAAFRDLTAQPGHSYLYRVTAVDRQHNESAPSGEIRDMLRR
jgi:hypothetical protein